MQVTASQVENVSLTYNHNFRQGGVKGMVHITVPEFSMPTPKAAPKPKPSYADKLEEALSHVLGVALIETYSLAKDLKHFGKEGEIAVSKGAFLLITTHYAE